MLVLFQQSGPARFHAPLILAQIGCLHICPPQQTPDLLRGPAFVRWYRLLRCVPNAPLMMPLETTVPHTFSAQQVRFERQFLETNSTVYPSYVL